MTFGTSSLSLVDVSNLKRTIIDVEKNLVKNFSPYFKKSSLETLLSLEVCRIFDIWFFPPIIVFPRLYPQFQLQFWYFAKKFRIFFKKIVF